MSFNVFLAGVRWEQFLSEWKSRRDVEYLCEQSRLGAPWILGPSDPGWDDHINALTDASFEYDALRGAINDTVRSSWDRFAFRTFWGPMRFDRIPKELHVPLHDYHDDRLMFSMAPATAAEYCALWRGLSLDDIREPFAKVSRHAPRFQEFDQLAAYLGGFGRVICDASQEGCGVILALLV